MNIFAGLLGDLVSDETKAQATTDKITDAIEAIAKEFELNHNDIAFLIRPKNAEFDFQIFACKLENGSLKASLREVTVLEIVGGAASTPEPTA